MLETVQSEMPAEHPLVLPPYREEDVILFTEGLIGYEDCTRFVVAENANIAPLHLIQCVDEPEVSFLVIDPRMIDANYYRSIPANALRSVGAQEASQVLALATVVLGTSAQESTANLRAPLLINFSTMRGCQVIFAEPHYSVTQRVMQTTPATMTRKARAAGAK